MSVCLFVCLSIHFLCTNIIGGLERMIIKKEGNGDGELELEKDSEIKGEGE
jgi:hypothetical protein